MSVDTNKENSTRVQKNTAADLRIRAVNVFCAVKPQRKMLPVFNIKTNAFKTNKVTENMLNN